MRTINTIILHHSATEDSPVLDTASIRNYHINVLGWLDIGYHYVVENIRGHYEVVIGRPIDWVGAHAKGHNEKSIGICFIGNYSEEYPAEKMIQIALKRIVVPLVKTYDIDVCNIIRHSDVNKTECPGKKFGIYYIRNEVKKRL